jgi:elongation factor G
VAYRETLTKPTEQEAKFVQQTGGRGQFGHVKLRIEPMDPGFGFEFSNKIVGGVIPREFIPSVEKGVIDAMNSGPQAGFPLIDLRVTLIDGSYHPVDSSEMSFKVAGSLAIREGVKKCAPKLLEPVMHVEVVTPPEYLGDILGDLQSRRARIEHIEMKRDMQFVECLVPLSEMFGYATVVRSASQGRATYTMQFSHYDKVPEGIEHEIMGH